MKKKINKVWRWIRGIVLILLLLPILILAGIRVSGGMKMRKSNKEIETLLAKHQVRGILDTLSLRNRNINYLLTSDGEQHKDAIVFIHGSPGSMDAFLDYMVDTTLLSGADLITYDRPGYGLSGFGKAIRSLSEQSRILDELLKAFQYDRFWLVGHSYGGPMIVLNAMRYQDRIAGIVIISGSVSPELEPPGKWRKWIDLPLIRLLWPVALRVSNEELMPLKQDLMMIEDDWDRIHVPVAIIHGTSDVLVPFENLNYAKEKLTHADTVRTFIYKDESHFIVWTHKDQVVKDITSFIEEQK